MASTFGRLDPPRDRDARSAFRAVNPARSVSVVRELHADLLRQKRRAFLTASPLLLLALFA
jgi:hypothetical protein